MDELEKEGDHDEDDVSTDDDDDHTSDCENDDIAEVDGASDAKSATAQHLCDAVAWAETQEPVEQFMLHYEHAMTRRLRRPEPAWVKKIGGRVRHAAYLLGMSLPEFKPSSEFGVDVCGASSPMMPAVQPPVLSKPIAEPTLVPEKLTTVETVDVEDWELLDDMSLPEMEQHIQRNETARLPSAALQDCSDCKPTLKPVEFPPRRVEAFARDGQISSQKKAQPKTRKANHHLKTSQAAAVEKVQEKTHSVSAVEPLRIQGKIKARDYNKTKRSMKMNFGFIEVNPTHLKTLRLHPLWTSDMEKMDVFWHSKQCEYADQYGGDIVTFTVFLKTEGKKLVKAEEQCFQAENIQLKKRAEYWHAVAV